MHRRVRVQLGSLMGERQRSRENMSPTFRQAKAGTQKSHHGTQCEFATTNIARLTITPAVDHKQSQAGRSSLFCPRVMRALQVCVRPSAREETLCLRAVSMPVVSQFRRWGAHTSQRSARRRSPSRSRQSRRRCSGCRGT